MVSDCGKYLILAIVKDCRDNIIYYADLIPGEEIKSELNVKVIVNKFESDYDVSTNLVIFYYTGLLHCSTYKIFYF